MTKQSRFSKIFVSIIAILLGLQPLSAVAGISESVDYLKTQVDDAWITMALAAANQSDIPTSHLKQIAGTSATDYAKAILALSAVGKNPATFGNVDYVAMLKNKYDGNQIGDVNLLNDDAWAILALGSVGAATSAEVQGAKAFLLTNQNADGGWSYSVGAGSDTNDTSAVVMALLEAGVSAGNQVIVKALNYLKSAQNPDGGFGYQPGNDSDSGSDSWVISALIKAGINPASWSNGGHDPISHLQSLEDEDGGFWWVSEGTSEWNNKAMTAFAVVALSGKTYPVGYYQTLGNQVSGYHLRIEGADNMICDTYVQGSTALAVLENAAADCGYTYQITQESFGPYLRKINNEEAAGLDGWLFFVNNTSPLVGAADYVLSDNDEVLWYFGEWGWLPTRLSIDQTEINPGESINITVEYFDGGHWLPLSGALINLNGEMRSANQFGQLNLTIGTNGIYQLDSATPGYVRSNKVTVTVGDIVSQKIGLQVEINQGGRIGGEGIALVVSPAQINFGTLRPGQFDSQVVNLANEGTVNLTVSADVAGDSLFMQGISIDSGAYGQYSQSLASFESKEAQVTLSVPSNYLGAGVKNGELIFWATSQ